MWRNKVKYKKVAIEKSLKDPLSRTKRHNQYVHGGLICFPLSGTQDMSASPNNAQHLSSAIANLHMNVHYKLMNYNSWHMHISEFVNVCKYAKYCIFSYVLRMYTQSFSLSIIYNRNWLTNNILWASNSFLTGNVSKKVSFVREVLGLKLIYQHNFENYRS